MTAMAFLHWAEPVAKLAAMAAAYYVVGRLGLLLAIPPGYATAVWPASGVALAGILLFGYRVWPGVLLGSFLINLRTSLDTTSSASIINTTLLAAGIGMGASLQAIIGAFLIRRFTHYPTAFVEAAADLFKDYMTTAVEDGEILTEVRLPAMDGYGFGYEKFNRRKEDWAMVAVAAWVKKAGDGSVEDVRIGLTHMASTPLRATAAEQALREGRSIAEAAALAAEGTDPPADLNASAEYKRHLATVLCRRALEQASQ